MNTEIISIGLPVRNEERTIRKAVGSALRQQVPKGFKTEVLVCVNDSTDKTAEIVKDLAEHDGRIRLIETQEPGKPNAMNLIKASASGKILVYCDADTTIESGTVATLVGALKSNPELYAVTARPETQVGKEGVFGKMARVWRAGSPYHGINGSLFAILKEKMPVLPKEILNDDGWLTAQIQQRFQHVSGVNARKQVPFTFRDYLNQRARMYAANVQLSEMGISKPLSVRKEVLSRLKRLGNLKNKEKSLLLLAIPIEAFAAILGRKRYKQGKYARGWTSPRRD